MWFDYNVVLRVKKDSLVEYFGLLRGADREPKAREAGPEASVVNFGSAEISPQTFLKNESNYVYF